MSRCVAPALCDVGNYRSAVLQFNALTVLPDVSTLANLTYLDVSHNRLTSLVLEAAPLPPSLIKLKASGNQLCNSDGLQGYVYAFGAGSAQWGTFHSSQPIPSCQALSELWLCDNTIQSLPALSQTLAVLPSLNNLMLAGNPFLNNYDPTHIKCGCAPIRLL